jgi:hypothetical protein
MDSLKVLDPERPIREVDMRRLHRRVGFVSIAVILGAKIGISFPSEAADDARQRGSDFAVGGPGEHR